MGKFRLPRGHFFTPEGVKDLVLIEARKKGLPGGMTVQEIAKKRGVLPDTVYKAYRRAKEKGLLGDVTLAAGDQKSRMRHIADLGAEALGEVLNWRRADFMEQIEQLKSALEASEAEKEALLTKIAALESQNARLENSFKERVLAVAGGNVKSD